MSGPGPLSPAIAVTGARIVAIPGIVALILVDEPAARWCAAGLYAAAALSDRLDGRLARARGQVTVAGAFLDPLADRLLVAAALIALVQIGEVGAWAAVVLIALEFAVSGLRLVAVSEDVIIPAGRFARVAALSLDVTLVALIVPADARSAGRRPRVRRGGPDHPERRARPAHGPAPPLRAQGAGPRLSPTAVRRPAPG